MIEARPSMYLGWAESDHAKRLHSLQALIAGYALALHYNGGGKVDLAAIHELEEFLRRRSGAAKLHPIDQILSSAASDQEAWVTLLESCRRVPE